MLRALGNGISDSRVEDPGAWAARCFVLRCEMTTAIVTATTEALARGKNSLMSSSLKPMGNFSANWKYQGAQEKGVV